MHKKDYELIAKAIKKSSDGQDNVRYVVEAIADALKQDNDRFDFDRFMLACGFFDYNN